MKNVLKRIAMGVGGVVIVALLLALVAPKAVHAIVSTLVTVANTSSNPVPVENVKQAAANFVTITSIGGAGYNQVLPDGSTTPFSIPSGERFVITDFSWVAVCSRTFVTCTKSNGDVVIVTFGSSSPFAPGEFTSQGVYEENNFFSSASSNVSLKSGMVVTVLPQPSILFGASGDGENVVFATLSGYLVPASSPSE